MDARKRIHWTQLRIGIAATLVLVAVATSIFFIDDLRLLFEDRYTLHFRTLTTQTVRVGSPVWYAGQPVGRVQRLDFEPPTRAASERLRVILSIRSDVRPYLVEGSTVQIITAGRIGQTVVNIVPPPEPGPPMPEGGELAVARKLDLDLVIRGLQEIVDSIAPMAEAWGRVMAIAQDGDGTFARFVQDAEALETFQERAHRTTRVLDDLGGTARQLTASLGEPSTRASLTRIGRRLSELSSRMEDGDGSLGALVDGDGIMNHLERIESTIARLADRLATGRGSLGRFLNDPALRREWLETQAAVTALLRDLRLGAPGELRRRARP